MFYTYLWLREDGTPYYVGKGHGNRAFRKGCPIVTVVEGYIEEPDKDRIILQMHSSEEEAFLAEVFLIAHYGRKDTGTGCLINLTNGGEGQSGRIVPECVREKLAKASTGRTVSEETKRKIGSKNKGRMPALPFLTGEGNPSFGKPMSEKQKKILSEANIGHTRSYGNTNAKGKRSEESRKNMKRPHVKKTHCVRGHKRSEENLTPKGQCIMCRNISNAKRYRKEN